ncbi:MAP3K epsilon protein kinase 1 isoform X2 [Physcomitrium patens]|uniref:MAP3K epsilon protein kinase 1 isoform X2 n=1 Tax=Physcomitrium patens TaxID=3218 RepID=UPI000D168236|nr:MAP3K epsilon protein kinase 1-like isoform X2 [Physcomitrium patens]|eukprot:XP_024396250.1 MAP3K epsilon protein kinase 1-like isoform X2 [Physcomitrella patens]
MSRHTSGSAFHKSKTLNDKYMLGDEIGKGAYGRVYKGLDLENGDFVAIKQVSLENIPPEDLASIMNLNHRNIVKYQGSFKTKTHLYIILEFVENGSLANNIKPNKFGALPENVVGRYIAQVLEGLVYLHEQGVIHRDIKGANILTTKEGEVKLADFGVATKLTEADINTHSVVGTPYWMAPEVIEMSGVSAASDIWSVGCTVIELLTCVPPYYDLQPMPALFRIVQDDHPPLPEHVSEVIIDFLRQCFQKDAKRRPDAQTLLGHAWIRKSRREKRNGVVSVPRGIPSTEDATSEESRTQNAEPASEDAHTRDPFESGSDDGNANSLTTSLEASSSQSNSTGPRAPLRIPSHGIAHFPRLPGSHDQDLLETYMSTTAIRVPPTVTTSLTRPPAGSRVSESPEPLVHNTVLRRTSGGPEEHAQCEANVMRSTSGKFSHLLPGQKDAELKDSLSGTEICTWKNDIHGMKTEVNGNHVSTQAVKPSTVHSSKFTDGPLDDNTNGLFFGSHEASPSVPAVPNHGLPPRGGPSLEIHATAAKMKAKTAQSQAEAESLLTAKTNGYESSIDLDDDDSVRTGLGMVIRTEGSEYLAKQALEVSRLMAMLKLDETEEVILAACQKLSSIFREFPKQKQDFMKPHGLIPLMDMLDMNNNRVIHAVLQVLNLITDDNVELLESACRAGLIPIMMSFASPECSKEMRMQAAYFVQKICHKSSLTLQMFIACRGLPVLVGLLEKDYARHREMVHMAIDGIWQVLELPGLSLKNDFCHIFARSSILARLVDTLHTLNEASRVPNGSMTTEQSRPLSSEKAFVKSQSGPIDQSRIVNKEVFRSRSGQLDHTPVRVTHDGNQRNLLGLNNGDSSRMLPWQAHRACGLPEFSWQNLPGQLEYTGQHSGHLTHMKLAISSERLSDPFQPGYGESTWVLGGDGCRRERDDEARSDGEARPLLADEAWGTPRCMNGLVDTSHLDEHSPSILNLIDKDLHMKPVSGLLDPLKQVSVRESVLPTLHHSGVVRKMNDNEKLGGTLEMSHIPSPKYGWGGTGFLSPSAKLSPSPSARMNLKLSGALSNTAEPAANTSSSTSQTTSGQLSRLQETHNPEEAQEYLGKVANLLLEFSRADTAVKKHMCSTSLLQRLLQMLNTLPPPILIKILECIKQLSQDPFTLEYLQLAEAMKHLIPFLEARDGPYVGRIHNQVLNALHNLCKINKRRQEQAAECGIIPHLMHFIKINSPLKQFALPLLCDMAHASRTTRELLRTNRGLDFYLSLLDDEVWAVTALDSLAVCLAHDNEQRKVEQALLQKDALQRLVAFFQSCGAPSFVHILEPFLKIISKSVRLNTALAVSGLTPLLVARLENQDAIARLTLLKLIRAVYEHHPRPKQLIVEHDLPTKLQRLIEDRRDGERSGGQVLVKQMAYSLLRALHINTVL